jgi:succinoglycan biosynthesis transport protein ExoP
MPPRDSSNQQISLRSHGVGPAAPADPTYFLPKVETGRIIGGVLRRGWVVVLCGMIGIAGALAYLKVTKKIYRSTGSVYVLPQAPQVINIQAVAPEESKDLEQMRSVEQGMSGSTMMNRLIETQGLRSDPDFAPPGTGPETLVKILSGRVVVGLRRGTRIIDIAVDDTKPDRAKELVSALVAEYEKWSTDRQRSVTEMASEGLAREEQRLRGKMEESAAEVQRFRERHRVPGLESAEGGAPLDDTLVALNGQLAQAKSERLRLEAEYEAFRRFDPEDPTALAGIGNSEQATEVMAQVRAIQEKEADFAVVKERYLEKHPVHKSMVSELALLKRNLVETTRTAGEALEKKYNVAKENEAKLDGAVAAAKAEAVEIEGLREKFRALGREAAADRSLHETVAARLRETTLAASGTASVLRWEDLPMTPEKAHSPRKIVALGLGMCGGLLIGMLLFLGLELTDGKIRDASAAARATGSPLLVRIPSSGASGAFRQLRAVLSPDNGAESVRTILFASARKGEGRSFCALNYATTLAMQGHRTLLLDADLTSPGLSASHAGAGLGDFLSGDVAPAEACFTTDSPNLYLLSSGNSRPDAADLLAGSRFAALLEDAYRWFDRVVIDTPALLSTSDAASIARYADRCCLVVSSKGNERRELQRASEMIRSAGGSLVGFVWNEVPDKSGTTGESVVRRHVGALSNNPEPAALRRQFTRHGLAAL